MSLSSGDTKSSTQVLSDLLREEGFEHFGFALLTTPISIGIYESWLEKGYQGEMSYLERHLPDKREPQRLLKQARSAIVITVNYVPHPEPLESWPLSKNTRVAAYARGEDYHYFIQRRLKQVISRLQGLFPSESFVSFTDSGAVLERDLASRAGLGWIGKNTCLIDRKKGSLFLLAEIYTTLVIPSFEFQKTDHCGTCTRCLEACPTGALVSPRELDARRCISYLTIESREVPPLELREKMQDWFFGCDICQTVCPWNIKAFGKEALQSLDPTPGPQGSENLVEDLRFILTSSHRALERAFQGTPLSRAGGFGLKRNALVLVANQRLHELTGEVSALLGHAKLGELAKWTIEKLHSSPPLTPPLTPTEK